MSGPRGHARPKAAKRLSRQTRSWPLAKRGEPRSRHRREVPSNHARVPSGNPEQGQPGAVRLDAVLLPVLQRAHADTERLRKPRLSEPHEPPKRGDVTGLELPGHDALALVAAQRSLEVLTRELGWIQRRATHGPCPRPATMLGTEISSSTGLSQRKP